MSMPGFVFHFLCDTCDATSGDYSAYVFHDIFAADIGLPAWSPAHNCWMTIYAHLSSDQRRAMESDRDALLSFAASLSSENVTVGVPQLIPGHSQSFDVNVTPDPKCPYCGNNCQSIFGYPPREEIHDSSKMTDAEFRAAPLSLVALSVRAQMICRDLRIRTLGQLEGSRSQFTAHTRATDVTEREINEILSRKPTGETSKAK